MLRITVCNNRHWPNEVVLQAVAADSAELVQVNATLQALLAGGEMFRCAEWLGGRDLTADLAREYVTVRKLRLPTEGR